MSDMGREWPSLDLQDRIIVWDHWDDAPFRQARKNFRHLSSHFMLTLAHSHICTSELPICRLQATSLRTHSTQ